VISATIDLYAVVNGGAPQNLSNLPKTLSISGIGAAAISNDDLTAVFTDVVDGGEGVELADLRTGSVRRIALDTKGCIRPLAICIACFYTCLTTPHLSPDKSKVLYAVKRNMPFYTVNTDGSGLTQLPVMAGTLAPSPQRVISDSGLVVFTSGNLYLMDMDGGNIRNLTPGSFPGSASNATISADGNTIVFEVSASSGPIEIWTVQSDGSGLRQLTSRLNAATLPSLSADGSTVAFVQSGQINVVRTDSLSQSAAVTALRFSAPQSPVISGDGRRIAFLTGPNASQPGAVYQVDADGSNLHPVYAPRAISQGGVTSAASGAVAPSIGSLISIYGINLTPLDRLVNAEAFPLPRTLAGLSVAASGLQLPLVTVSPWQINAQLPQNMPAGPTTFQVTFSDGFTALAGVTPVTRNGPAVFTDPNQQAAAFHAGTGTPADADHPASPGEILETYGVGLGQTNPAVEAGVASPSNPIAQAAQPPELLIGGQSATVVFAGLAPGLAGVYQINAMVPSAMKAGRYPVTWRTADTPVTSAGFIVVQ
ncbi:MAG: hypothetical protein M3Y27_13350, partial [Acidobacteriota bacterium]|nr:hypothetical protein [Acidobacteriota bacterium]